MQWGDRWIHGAERAPVRVLDREAGAEIARMEVMTPERKPLQPKDVVVVPGPGADEAVWRRFGKAETRT